MTDLLQTLWDGLVREVEARRHLPEATYRVQFHAGFTFEQARQIVPYLHDLGITHLYASPFLKARPGSTHGYDIIDHRELNPEVGNEQTLNALVEALHKRGMGQILDMVPNHMGVFSNENPWWNDVLESGPASPHGEYFDIAWNASPRPELRGRVLLPMLGDPYGKVLESGQLKLTFDSGAFVIHYYEHQFPVAPQTYGMILEHRLDELRTILGAENPALAEYESIITAVANLPRPSPLPLSPGGRGVWGEGQTDPARVALLHREKEVIKRRLNSLAAESQQVREFLTANVTIINGRPDDPRSFDLLDKLLDQQAYRLSYWRVASDEINYRRFFDVNDLAALSMEREDVFRTTHQLIFRLLAEGKLNGLRIDHPDGLYDPKQYLCQLQEFYWLSLAQRLVENEIEYQSLKWEEIEGMLRERIAAAVRRDNHGWQRALYVVVEKILGSTEPLPPDWATHGTSGYDMLNKINGLFVHAGNEKELTEIYQQLTGIDDPFAQIVYDKKYLILQVSLSSELQMLAWQLDRLAQKDRWSRDFTFSSLRHALRDIIAFFPVYRSYITEHGVSDQDRRYVERAVRLALLQNPTFSPSLFRFIRDMLLLRYSANASEADQVEQRRFVGKFQQVTSPVMAKGLEDTTFYVYNRLVSLNEVGGDPGQFGVSPEALHAYLLDRQQKWPYGLSPLSTHDTKRSEDVRARIHILSERPQEWREALIRWRGMNAPHRRDLEDGSVPDVSDAILIYQTLLGAWPLESPFPSPPGGEGDGVRGDEDRADFVKRIQAYTIKAMHEAKVHTSWINPNQEYDTAAEEFIARILDEAGNKAFLDDFQAYQKRVSHWGMFNSLAQTLLRITAPGVPDTYQGSELWDFSLVDPDNRRPVDYERRRNLLRDLQERAASSDRKELASELLGVWQDSRIKLYITWQALCCRRDHAGLFSAGEYLPIEVAGGREQHVFAFVRRHGDLLAIAVVPRLVTQLIPNAEGAPIGGDIWQDTVLLLPRIEPQLRLRNLFTGEVLTPFDRDGRQALHVADVLAVFPVALFLDEPRAP